MRPGQNKRMRGRPNNGGGGHRKGPNPLTRSYESNGPDVKIRGNAHHIAEKYLQLARDAQSSGDPVAAESYLQHAEHYFRLIASAQAAQAGYARQPDAVDAEMDDDDDSGIPDRFASPQPPTPAFVPQPQAYAAERQPYGNGDRQPYGDRPGNAGGERPPYADRQGERQPYAERQGGERAAFGDRNGYGQNRQDRNGAGRRPYRDNVQGGDVRADDRQGGQERSQDRPLVDRSGQERPDRQTRRERFAQDRQERQGQDRNGQDRGYDRQDRGQNDRLREPSVDAGHDLDGGEQPRSVETVGDRTAEAFEPVARAERSVEAEPQPAFRPEPSSREDDAPGLPSFITTPTRVAPVEPAAETAPEIGTAAFPGDGDEPVPKFPRRRRRTTRAAADAPADQPLPSGD